MPMELSHIGIGIEFWLAFLDPVPHYADRMADGLYRVMAVSILWLVISTGHCLLEETSPKGLHSH